MYVVVSPQLTFAVLCIWTDGPSDTLNATLSEGYRSFPDALRAVTQEICDDDYAG